MSSPNALEALQGLHRDLVAVCEHRLENMLLLEQSLEAHAEQFKKLLEKAPRKKESRDTVQSGKVKIDDEEYSLNKEFQENALQLADEVDLDEIEAARLLLESEDDQITLGRPLLECGLIRFHQQRKYLLDCMRLCIQLADDDDLEPELQTAFGDYTAQNVYGAPAPGQPDVAADKKIVPRCMAAMQDIRQWLQRLADRITTASVVYQGGAARPPEFEEAIEYSRLSLIQQHESLAVILRAAIDKRYAGVKDFENLLQLLKRSDRYDHLLVHFFPVVGAYIQVYGSTEGVGDLTQARQLNQIVCKRTDDDTWQVPSLNAAICAWWIAEYSGWYVADQMGAPLDNIDVDEEDKQRAEQFAGCLKEGALDFILSLAADVKTPEWQDPSRIGVEQQWLQRKSPPLATDFAPFSDFFQLLVMEQLESFIDAFISNLPDVLRKLRVEEDEQRQLSQAHEQDLDLERFLLIISYAYEGRPTAAEAFWADPDSNMHGFLQWASRRASTPLVSAFCEMLRAISEDESSADSAHEFLLDESLVTSGTGKMRKSQSLTWTQIFKELEFFTAKIRDRTNAPQAQTYRAGKPSSEQAEAEPESAIMLECYMRLIAKLSSNSSKAREFLLIKNDPMVVNVLFNLASLMIPERLRASVFYALKALLTQKSEHVGHAMWTCLESFMSGHNAQSVQASVRSTSGGASQSPGNYMDSFFTEMGRGFEQPNAFVQFLLSLVAPAEDQSPLNDSLPFPETQGCTVRMPGIEPYVDFVLGAAFAKNSPEVPDALQRQILRLSCLEFALTCLETFNEDLILIANETTIPVDSVISTSDLAAYVRLHPFARVMEWMFSRKVVDSTFSTIHQDSADVGSASPESPLIMGIIRAVEVISKVLELQDTYLDLVRNIIRVQSPQRRPPVNHSTYAFFEEGIMNHLGLILDLGMCCGLGHPALTLACLKLLEKVSTSSKIVSAWNHSPGQQPHRNKAIVALEKDGESESIAGSFIAELVTPLDLGREADSPNYMIKIYILDFLYSCLEASPDQPTIAHLLLGFRCGLYGLSIEQGGAFDSRTSLFHNLLRVLLEAPFGDGELGMRQWLVVLKFKVMRVFQILWRSPLSSALVLNDLRENDFLFHLLLREVVIQPSLPWDGQEATGSEFLLSDASVTFIEFLALRAMTLEYIGMELCSVSQNRLPNLKRRIFDALNGGMVGDSNEPMTVPTIFDLYDFLSSDGQWDIPPPQFTYYKDLDLRMCVEEGPNAVPTYDVEKAQEILLLKRAELGRSGLVLTKDQEADVQREEALLLEYLVFSNRQKQLASNRLILLRSWTNLLLVMFESNEFKGSAKVSFLLQALQAILPSLEAYGSDSPDEAFELAKLARILLFKLDFDSTPPSDKDMSEKDRRAIGDLVSDKLFQLFQICLFAIGKWAGSPDLRAVYYSICYRYVTGIVDEGRGFLPGRQKTIKSIHVYGERLLNVICDDAYGSDAKCQTAALILLGALVNLGNHQDDTQIVETLNRLNFIGVLVDSLKNLLEEGLRNIQSGSLEQQQHLNAKIALLLQLCQTRDGAKYVLHANLFRAIELSGLFSADPELQIDPTNTAALSQYYALLVKVARVIGAAILSRGAHNVLQGRRFLTEHRMLVMHVLKRSAGIGAVARALDERIEELAEAFMVLITATGFLEFEDQAPAAQQRQAPTLFH